MTKQTDLIAQAAKLQLAAEGRIPRIEAANSMRIQQLSARGGIGIPTGNSANPSSFDSFNQRTGLQLNAYASQIQVAFANVKSNTGGNVSPGESAITLQCALEVGANVYPIYWPNGSRSITLEPDAHAISNRAGIILPPGLGAAVLRVHGTWASPPSEIPIANGTHAATSAYDSNSRGVGQADNTLGTMPTGIGLFSAIFPPLAVIGLTTPAPAVLAIGDSNRGWSVSGLTQANVRRINVGADAFTMAAFDGSQQDRFRGVFDTGLTHALVTIAGGDVTAGATAAQLISRAQSIRDKCVRHGLVPIFATTPPKTNDSNTAVKSTSAWDAIQGYNNYLRDHRGMGYGYFDLFDRWGSRGTGLWRTDLGTPTDDGTHAAGALHSAAAAALAVEAAGLFV